VSNWHNVGYFDCADYIAHCMRQGRNANPFGWDVLWHCPEFAILGNREGAYNLLICEAPGMWMLTLPRSSKALLAFLRDAYVSSEITERDWIALRRNIATHARGSR
jgi:hypothetical protein